MPCIVVRSLVLKAVTKVVKTKVGSLKSDGGGTVIAGIRLWLHFNTF